MKVDMIVRDLEYGIGTHTQNLVNSLIKLGVEVDIIQGHGNLRTSLKVPSRGADIVHIQGSPFNIIGSDLPTVVTVHTLLKTEMKYSGKYNLKNRIGLFAEKRTLNNADRIIVVNPCLIYEINNYGYSYKIERSSIHTIPNGVNFEEFDGRSLDRDNFFMAAGRKIGRKDFATFREACKLANAPYAEFHNVSRKKLIEGFKTAKAFVCSSLYETGPITILEAMAARCPIICTREVADNMIPPRPPGIHYRAGKVDDLKFAIERMMSYDNNFLKEMTENAYKMAIPYSWDNIAKETLKVYEEIV
ncbi:MAG: glycosyltransferase family 4 protein [Thaumarchaeota archaeon]|nr:MAG: glycosyltransferase family 4 protein [Nitrososphaerota archaeon]